MDTILYGGTIRTMSGRIVSALAINKGRIVLAGSDQAALGLKGEHTQCIDLQGRLVLPGFCDSHMHMLLTGVECQRLDLRGVGSLDELIQRGRTYVTEQQIPPGEWIVGYGFDHNCFDTKQLPDRHTAEAISTQHPVVLDRVCGHVGAINGLAMDLAGYTPDTIIPGGELDKAADGSLNGIIRETALDHIKTFFPKLSQEQVTEHLREMGKTFAACGLTSVHSDDLGPEGCSWDVLGSAMETLQEQGDLRVRIFEEWQAPKKAQLLDIIQKGYQSGSGTDYLQVCNIKLITDGSLGARTAYLREEYSDDPGNRGIPVYDRDTLNELVSLCQKAGLQIAFHAIGDAAIAQCVDAVELAMAENPKPLCHRIVHCQIGDRALYERMASLGMGADIQPPFTVTDAPHVAPRLGDRASGCYAWKTLLDTGVHLGGGSDSPVEQYDPLWGIYCSVTRSDGKGTDPWMPEERLTVEEAVRIYTQGPAFLAGQVSQLGSLEPGKLADLVVLDRDIFTVDPEEIKETNVLLTMMGGYITYQHA